MKAIRLYRHPECERCAGYARMHHRFDWLGRFEDTTETPPTGELRVGEIAAQDLRTGATLKGIDCFRLLCKHIPAYWFVLPLTTSRQFAKGLRTTSADVWMESAKSRQGKKHDSGCPTTTLPVRHMPPHFAM